MRVLGLDLSTHIGWAVVNDEKLEDYGTHDVVVRPVDGEIEDYEFIRRAEAASEFVSSLLAKHDFDQIVIEQTNLGTSRTDQKLLEFIHFSVLRVLKIFGAQDRVVYANSSSWRSFLQVKLSKEQKAHNKKLKTENAILKEQGKKATRKKGEGKITPKHLAVAWVNERFGLSLKLVDNDAADAIALAIYGLGRSKRVQGINVDDVLKSW